MSARRKRRKQEMRKIHKALKAPRGSNARRRARRSDFGWMSRPAGVISLREMPVAFTGYGLSGPHCGPDSC